MNRRVFGSALAGLAVTSRVWSADNDRHTRFYTLEAFQLKQGTQPVRVHEWLNTGLLPRMSKVHAGPVIVLDAVFGPHTPQIVVITGYSSFEEIWNVRSKIDADAEAGAAYEKLERGPEPPFETKTLS